MELEGENMGFIAQGEQVPTEWGTFTEGLYTNMIRKNNTMVKILRPMLFFCEAQPGVTLGKLREFYTEKAITSFEKYGYFKFL